MTALANGVLFGLLLSAVFVSGFWFRGTPTGARLVPAPGTDSAVGSYPLLTEVQNLLNSHFLRPQPEQKQLEYGAIRGMLNTLNDKYTFLVDPPVAHSESDVLAGKYGGIGVQVKRDETGNFALYPFPDSPAAHAGVQDGDILLKINNKDLPLTTQQDAVDQMLRGEVKNDNGVAIRVKRGAQEMDFSIVFAEIDIPSVVWRVLAEDSSYGYVQIMRFTNRTPDELKQAITALKAKNVKALVLDLRDNPGGLLQESIQVAGQFLNGGVVVYEHSRDSDNENDAPNGGLATDLPVVALVNKDTASAAELVAGALKDRKRAVIIGQQTYGKGTVQLLFTLSDQSSLHVTTAEWLSPNKIPLDGKGITPDIPMIPDQNGRDVELGEAVHYLQTGKS